MIKTIFFDLGGVLIDFSHQKMCQNIATYCDLDIDLVKKILLEEDLSGDYERGSIDDEQLFLRFKELSQKPIEFNGLMEAASCIFSEKPEIIPFLEILKKQNIQLILLSNTCRPHISYIDKHYNLLNYFDGRVLSYEAKARKPEKKIYRTALETAKMRPELCFYTDDVAEYVQAAQNFGIDSHHFQGMNGLIKTLENRGIKTHL